MRSPVRRRADARAGMFFYGTLLDPDIQRRVIGRALPARWFVPATLAGFRRVRVAGRWFPVLVPGLAHDRVAGGLALGLGAAERARILAYEGPLYSLVAVTVELADGRRKCASVFLPRSGIMPTAEPWDLARFQREDKPRVLRSGL